MKNLFIKRDDVFKYTNSEDFYFFTRINDQTFGITKEGSIRIDASLNYINEIIGSDFLRTHKSFLVNVNKIDSISKFTGRTYNIKFVGIHAQAYITNENLKILLGRTAVL